MSFTLDEIIFGSVGGSGDHLYAVHSAAPTDHQFLLVVWWEQADVYAIDHVDLTRYAEWPTAQASFTPCGDPMLFTLGTIHFGVQYFLCNNPDSGDKIPTVWFDGAPSALHMISMLVAGGDAASFDAVASKQASSASSDTLALTTATDNELILSLALAGNVGAGGGGYMTAGALYTEYNPAGWECAEYLLDAGSAGAQSVPWNIGWPYDFAYALTAAAFKLAGAVGGAAHEPVRVIAF